MCKDELIGETEIVAMIDQKRGGRGGGEGGVKDKLRREQ